MTLSRRYARLRSCASRRPSRTEPSASSAASASRALDASLDANLARCARLRQAVWKRAFEGRLVPAEGMADAPSK